MSYKTVGEEWDAAIKARDARIADLVAVLKTTQIALRNALAILEINLARVAPEKAETKENQ